MALARRPAAAALGEEAGAALPELGVLPAVFVPGGDARQGGGSQNIETEQLEGCVRQEGPLSRGIYSCARIWMPGHRKP